MVSGCFVESSSVYLGPLNREGEFKRVKIISIERYRSTSKMANFSQDAGISLDVDWNIKFPKQVC